MRRLPNSLRTALAAFLGSVMAADSLTVWGLQGGPSASGYLLVTLGDIKARRAELRVLKSEIGPLSRQDCRQLGAKWRLGKRGESPRFVCEAGVDKGVRQAALAIDSLLRETCASGRPAEIFEVRESVMAVLRENVCPFDGSRCYRIVSRPGPRKYLFEFGEYCNFPPGRSQSVLITLASDGKVAVRLDPIK